MWEKDWTVGMRTEVSWFGSEQRRYIILSSTESRAAVIHSDRPLQWVAVGFSTGLAAGAVRCHESLQLYSRVFMWNVKYDEWQRTHYNWNYYWNPKVQK